MASNLANPPPTEENVGIHIDPKHNLYVAAAALRLQEVRDGSSLQPGEVTVAIKSTGICGFIVADPTSTSGNTTESALGKSQDLTSLATNRLAWSLQHILRSRALSWATVWLLSLTSYIVCGACEPCLTGRYNGCKQLLFRSSPPSHGLLRKYVNHPAMWCHKIGNLSFDEGALLEPLSVALTGVTRSGVKIGDPVLICGAGPIGLVTLDICRAAGTYPIVITDIDAVRLEFAKTIMPDVITHHVQRDDTIEQFADKINVAIGEDVEIAIALECTGVESSVSSAIQTVKFGGKVFVIGVGKEKMEIPFMRCSAQKVELQFQQRYVNMWPRAIRVLGSGIVNLKRLITHSFTLENRAEAFETASNPPSGSIKVIIRPEG